MQRLRPLLLAAATALPCIAQAAPTLEVCIDDAFGGFNYGTAVCVIDGGAGDALAGIAGAITTASILTGGLTITSSIGEPLFGPGFGMLLSVDGTVSGSWIVAVAQTGLERGAAPDTSTRVGAAFTGSTSSGPGTASYAVYADDLNRSLSAWGPVGTPVAGGSGWGSSGDYVTLTDPFSMLAFITLDASSGATGYSTDLTVTVPEPGSLSLLGVALLGLAGTVHRKKAARSERSTG